MIIGLFYLGLGFWGFLIWKRYFIVIRMPLTMVSSSSGMLELAEKHCSHLSPLGVQLFLRRHCCVSYSLLAYIIVAHTYIYIYIYICMYVYIKEMRKLIADGVEIDKIATVEWPTAWVLSQVELTRVVWVAPKGSGNRTWTS